MQYNQYRFKFYFNASHAIYLQGELGQSHPHTWEIVIHSVKITDSFVRFEDIEKTIETFLKRFQDVSINTVEPFTTTNPTLENICTYFKECIQEMLYEKGWLLLSIELSETPTRSYVISVSNQLDKNETFYNSQSEQALQDILEKLTEEKLNSMIRLRETAWQEAAASSQELFAPESQIGSDEEYRIFSTIFRKPYTSTVMVRVAKTEDSVDQFAQVENTVKDFLSHYENVLINTDEPLSVTNVALQNIGTYFQECIQAMLLEKGWLLISVDWVASEEAVLSETLRQDGSSAIQIESENVIKPQEIAETESKPSIFRRIFGRIWRGWTDE